MRKSARVLGEEHNLTAQEMNYILTKEGYQDGEPGDYSVTEKGASFAVEKDFHRGTGGYAHYNRYWITRTWDESIEDELHITDDLKREAREAVAAKRRQQWDEIKAARAEADAAFQEKYNQGENDSDATDESSDGNSSALGVALIIGSLIVGYVAYKAAPHVAKWWKGTIWPKIKGSKKSASPAKTLRKMLCPICGGTIEAYDDTSIWKCNKCNHSLLDEELKISSNRKQSKP